MAFKRVIMADAVEAVCAIFVLLTLDRPEEANRLSINDIAEA